jgi:FkbM family methyltransferase
MPNVSILGTAIVIDDLDGSATAARDCQQIARGEYNLAAIPFRPGDVVVDIGANVGVVSVFLAKRFPQLSIYAFEPVPPIYEQLCRNVASNGAFNIRPFNLAVTGDGKPVCIHFDPHNPGGSSASMVWGGCRDSGDGVPVNHVARHFAVQRHLPLPSAQDRLRGRGV